MSPQKRKRLPEDPDEQKVPEAEDQEVKPVPITVYADGVKPVPKPDATEGTYHLDTVVVTRQFNSCTVMLDNSIPLNVSSVC